MSDRREVTTTTVKVPFEVRDADTEVARAVVNAVTNAIKDARKKGIEPDWSSLRVRGGTNLPDQTWMFCVDLTGEEMRDADATIDSILGPADDVHTGSDTYCPRSADGQHEGLVSDEGGPVYCRHCQWPLKSQRTP